MAPLHLVWIKRDLRLQDHEALRRASEQGQPVAAFWLMEPSLEAHPAMAPRHWQWQYHSARALQAALRPYGIPLYLLYAEAVEALRSLTGHLRVAALYSYRETGLQVTYQRDQAVSQWLRQAGIPWQEFDRNGVQRGRRDRQGWDAAWRHYMQAPQASRPNVVPAAGMPFDQLNAWARRYALPPEKRQALQKWPDAFQKPGEAAGQERLHTYLDRGLYYAYNKHISRPLESRESCSRLGTYLAWGNVSLRQVYQAARARYATGDHRGALRAFISRLHWHSHFIQKFEMECRMEWENVNRGFDALDRREDPALLAAWKKGETGFPLVDACMRALQETGYVNFRMRAMLVSFLTHHLWQPWRSGVEHLAQLFLDFHPGIHYPQMQMQSAVTGINSVRTYNPVKQSQDHDEAGRFISYWLPALQELPNELIHQPWLLTSWEQQWYHLQLGQDYPWPVIDHQEAARAAKKKLFPAKNWPQVKAESRRILARHTTATRNTDQRTREVIRSS
ncbi:MAG: deoxyribodipyrimidine photo-lyase [Schleiferiaceae bacterium]|nr:deoxyribodipyrimidine photo-lyase [Schleiferiaceae bacterium]